MEGRLGIFPSPIAYIGKEESEFFSSSIAYIEEASSELFEVP